MLEVEAMIISGYATGIAISIAKCLSHQLHHF